MPALIAADVELVQGEVAKLSAVNELMSRDYDAWRLKRRPAEDSAIAKLQAVGGIVSELGGITRLRFRGVTASSTCGLSGALCNWATAATRKLEEPAP